MPNDQPFRIALLVGMALLVPVALFFRIRSQLAGERLDRRQEGLFILVTLRLCGVTAWVTVVMFLWNPMTMSWSSMPIPDALRWCGLVIGGFASVWVIWTFSHLGKNLTDTVVTRREHTLVTSGPYRWVRHPFYLGVAGLGLATSLTTANWFIAVTGVCAMVLLTIRTDREEAKLIERFGDEYRSYMQRTGRFWPKWHRRRVTP
ncbi:MAG: isoprenylcysteine carboxylmethyltransferase family protein [Planctomycetales bacterium]|nr:isoprenylcysteine carboxylmethyltransferase family protein [Planctomycetales bacterium]